MYVAPFLFSEISKIKVSIRPCSHRRATTTTQQPRRSSRRIRPTPAPTSTPIRSSRRRPIPCCLLTTPSKLPLRNRSSHSSSSPLLCLPLLRIQDTLPVRFTVALVEVGEELVF